MIKIIIRTLLILLVLFTGLVVYNLLFGKLLVYSPITPGFTRTELEHTIIYVQKGAEFHETGIDTLPPMVEAFHELKFKHKPGIFIFKDESFRRYSLSHARFFAVYNGNIVCAPRAMREARHDSISLEIYLRHELSHSILFQNAGFFQVMSYPKWLLEGIAMYSANQMGTSIYPSKEKTLELIRQGYFMPPAMYRSKQEKRFEPDIDMPIAFYYSEFACLVDHMVAMYGREAFITYMQALLHNSNHDEVFQSVFHISFSDFIQEFRESVTGQ